MCMNCNKAKINNSPKQPTRTVGKVSGTRSAGNSFGTPKVRISFGNKNRGR